MWIRQQQTPDKDDTKLSVEDAGDSDSSSTPLISTIDRNKSNRRLSPIRLEKPAEVEVVPPDGNLEPEKVPLPDIKTSPSQAARKAFFDEMTGTSNKKDQDENVVDTKTSSPNRSPRKGQIVVPHSPEIECLSDNKKRLERSASSPPVKTTSEKLVGALSPIREYQSSISYEKGGSNIELDTLQGALCII